MEWLSQNWVWVLFFVAFIAMHMFGHGGHGGHGGLGGHGGHGSGQGIDPDGLKPSSKGGAQGNSGQNSGHQH